MRVGPAAWIEEYWDVKPEKFDEFFRVYKRDVFFRMKPAYVERHAQWTPPYTTAEPDITHHSLSQGDRFMVLATDGLFQDLTSKQVVGSRATAVV